MHKPKPKPAPTKPQPVATTAKDDKSKQIFAYHLNLAIVKVNEARERLGLPPVDYGDKTVPELLAELGVTAAGSNTTEASGENGGEPEE